MLESGIEVYEFKPDAQVRMKVLTGALQKKLNFTPIFGLHAKTTLIDDYITVIGTFKLDPRSANLNTECLAILYSKFITTGVSNYINEEFAPENVWKISSDFNPDDQESKTKRIATWTRKVLPKAIL